MVTRSRACQPVRPHLTFRQVPAFASAPPGKPLFATAPAGKPVFGKPPAGKPA
jgi:hypothetical protein